MDIQKIISEVENFVEHKLGKDSSGHDYQHILRVVNNAKYIMEKEGGSELEIILASWLHDIGDYKLNEGEDKTEELVKPFLLDLGFNLSFTDKIIRIISEVSFKGGHNEKTSSLEAEIVQDADRLDALGAIGIARAFAYGGSRHRKIYDPEERIKDHKTEDSYKNNKSSTISHFYEKLLKLKDLINTETAKTLAIERHEFMKLYLNEFYKEIKLNN